MVEIATSLRGGGQFSENTAIFYINYRGWAWGAGSAVTILIRIYKHIKSFVMNISLSELKNMK